MKNTKKTVTLESNEAIQKSGNNHLTSLNFIKKSGLNNMHKAFTLVELIVVITILAILGTIAFISFQNYTQSARDGTRIADINSIKKNLELFITEKGFYPLPDNGTQITYSGGTAWVQGTVGDNVITNLGRINKKPTDPLTDNEYTYSVTNSKTEYQLSYVTEGGLSYNIPLTNQTYAATQKTATAKVTGTYNEKILKVINGTTTYILAVPTIINANISTTDLQNIINNKELVYNNYSNLPDSYKNLGYTMTGGFDFAPPLNNIVVYSGTTDSSIKTETEKLIFLDNLKTIYNSTILKQEPIYTEIINSDTVINPAQAITLVDTYISNNVGGITGTPSVITYGCAQQPPYTDAIFTKGIPTLVNQTWQNTTNTNPCYRTCGTGKVLVLEQCVDANHQAICGGSIPQDATATTATTYNQAWDGTVRTPTINWGENQITCDFNCNTNYSWNGTTCELNTCASQPNYTNTSFIAGLPTQPSQTRQNTNSGNPCYYTCINGYTGNDCATPTFLSNCTANGQIYYADSIGIKLAQVSNTGTTISGNPLSLTCAGHIIVCNGINAGYTLRACNEGSSTVGATNNSAAYGNRYQWGNNYGSLAGGTTTAILANATGYNPPTYYTSTGFILGSDGYRYDWTTVQNDNLWGNTTNTLTARQGPCPTNYHVPSQPEWVAINTVGGWGTTLGTNLSNTLKLPMAGNRLRYSGNMNYQGNAGLYWSSSPNGTNGYYLFFYATSISLSDNYYRSYGLSVRCIKN